MKKYLLCTILAAFIFAGCEKEKTTDNNLPVHANDTASITHIKWHLTHFVDVTNKTVEEPLANNENAYWIKFDTTTFEGKSFSNIIMGYIHIDASKGKMDFLTVGGTEICEYYDGTKFINSLNQVHDYMVTSENNLVLFYDNNTKYLQFERIME